MITIFSYNPDKMMYRLHEFDNNSVDRYFDVPAEELYQYFSWANGEKNKMDTKRNYHSKLVDFVSDDRVSKESVINALSDLIDACEQHDELLTKLSNEGCFEYTLALIMDELTPKLDPLDESNKSPRIDCAGDRWAWSHRYVRWVVTDVNTDNETNAGKRFDPAYPGSTFVLKLDTVLALDNWCGPLRFAVDDV